MRICWRDIIFVLFAVSTRVDASSGIPATNTELKAQSPKLLQPNCHSFETRLHEILAGKPRPLNDKEAKEFDGLMGAISTTALANASTVRLGELWDDYRNAIMDLGLIQNGVGFSCPGFSLEALKGIQNDATLSDPQRLMVLDEIRSTDFMKDTPIEKLDHENLAFLKEAWRRRSSSPEGHTDNLRKHLAEFVPANLADRNEVYFMTTTFFGTHIDSTCNKFQAGQALSPQDLDVLNLDIMPMAKAFSYMDPPNLEAAQLMKRILGWARLENEKRADKIEKPVRLEGLTALPDQHVFKSDVEIPLQYYFQSGLNFQMLEGGEEAFDGFFTKYYAEDSAQTTGFTPENVSRVITAIFNSKLSSPEEKQKVRDFLKSHPFVSLQVDDKKTRVYPALMPEEIDSVIQNLDANDWRTRDTATIRLAATSGELRAITRTKLGAAIGASKSPELVMRAHQILDNWDREGADQNDHDTFKRACKDWLDFRTQQEKVQKAAH